MEHKLLYDAYPHQLPRHKSKAKYKYVMDPVRSGKDICMVNDNSLNIMDMKDLWVNRPANMVPAWNVWNVAETYKLLKQLWRDFLVYTPKEWIDGNPSIRMPQVDPQFTMFDGRIVMSFRSAHEESRLVAEGVDRVNVTEAGELPRSARELLRSRMSSPDRFEHSSFYANGTPRGQFDPADPVNPHWFWAELQSARQGKSQDADGWYWFEDKHNYGGLDHPILSQTPEGRLEIERHRHDPDFSERKFREDYLGECLPALIGDNAIKGFMQSVHVRADEYSSRYKIHVWIDFGRNYPAVTFHQFTDDGLWRVIGELAYVNADLIVEELASRIFDYIDRYCRNPNGTSIDKSYDTPMIEYVGDFEAKNREDSRRENTIEILRSKGINLIVQSKRQGDERAAIDVLNARMKRAQDGQPYMVIHPRCQQVIKCFAGMWVYETGKSGDYEYRKDSIAELHPWIDLFDTFKYGIVHTVIPHTQVMARIEREASQPRMVVRVDENGSPIGYREVR